MKDLALKKMLVVDFCCAFFGGFLYLLLLNFLIERLFFPSWLIKFQLTANFVYGFYGLVIFLSKNTSHRYLKILINMNSLYAVFCLVVAIKIFFSGFFAAGLILLIEALLIGTLVVFERKTWF